MRVSRALFANVEDLMNHIKNVVFKACGTHRIWALAEHEDTILTSKWDDPGYWVNNLVLPLNLEKKREQKQHVSVFSSLFISEMSRDHKVRCVSDMEKSDRLPTISWGLSSVTRRNTYLSLRVMNHCQTKTFGHYSYRFGRGICGKYARACLKIVQRYRRLGTTLISKAFSKREN